MTRFFDPTAPLPPEAQVAPVRHVYRRILRYMGEFRRGIGTAALLTMLSSVFVTLQPWPIKFLIDGVLVSDRLDLGPLGTVVSDTDGERLRVAAALAGAYFAVTVVGVLLGAVGFYFLARTALLMIHGLRSHLIAHQRTLSLRFHANQWVTRSGGRLTTPARFRT